ncbi:MAG: deoxyguanosinetriphosphate triphosphohydrolase [Lentisphaeria bacterium]|nr:deoxyguanosinetriphosphate triphosphohydrolase [Lentisphaeria bacterium]
MLRTKLDLRKAEECTLAPYAHFDRDNAGRQYPEKTHPFRTDFQRDRDRILHSHAFRRLEYKTQVFLSGSGDHLRNRLTHTIEVAAIAKTIARALAVNEDLTETIALAHDLGHPPFGHAGERAISKVMKDHGGFDHNLQALRIVDVLEVKYPQYDGINLTRDVRSGLLKHPEHRTELDGRPLSPRPSLEAQIADLADDLTYYGHDVDDGLDSGLLIEDMLKDIPIWQEAAEQAKALGLDSGTGERFPAYTVRCLIDNMVGDAIRYSAHLLEQYDPQSAEEVEFLPQNLISFSPDFLKKTLELKDFLYENLYFGKILDKLNALSLSRIEFLFETFCKDPSLMGETARSRLDKDGVERTAADYIAGMTDNFALMEYLRLHPKN